MQVRASNHLELRGSKARVVSVEEKARRKTLSGEGRGDERKRTVDDLSKA